MNLGGGSAEGRALPAAGSGADRIEVAGSSKRRKLGLCCSAGALTPTDASVPLFLGFGGVIWIFFTEFLSLACPVPWERLLGLFFGLCLTWKVLRSRAGRSWELPAQWVPELVPKPDLIYLIFSE